MLCHCQLYPCKRWGAKFPWLRDGCRLFSPHPHRKHKPWRLLLRQGHISMEAAETVSLDCSFASTQGRGHRTAPSHCVEELRSCSRQFPWGIFPRLQCLHQHPLENTEDVQVLHGLYVNESKTKHRKAQLQAKDKSPD